MCAKDGRQIYDLQPEEFYIEGKTELEGGNILYDLVPITENRTFPLCGCDGKKHGIYGPREVRDLPISLAQVGLRIKAHRYQCKECGNTWVNELLARFPEFERPYRMKEMIRDIYTKETKEEALEWYENIKTLLFEYDELYEFVQVFSTIDNWKEEIFNYFDHQYTNAVTENINKQINEIGEAGKGYTFEVLRAKAIFKNFAKKPNKFEFPDK